VPPSQVAPDLPAELDAMLLLGLHREPRRRWSSAGLLVDALEATLGPEGHEGEQEEDDREVDTASLAAPRPAGPAPGPTTERLTPATTTEPAGARAEQAPSRPGRGRLGIVAVAVGTLAVIAVAAVTLVAAIRSYDETPGGDEQQAAQPTREGTPEGEGASAPPEQSAPESPIPEAGAAGVDEEEAERLNSEGYDLIRSGDHEEAAERFRAGAGVPTRRTPPTRARSSASRAPCA
jgi:TolA-binding protein